MMNRPEVANPFSAADPISDLALVVEGKKLHVHKMILATSSPVFKAMFFPESSTDCKGKDAATELPLPGKNYDDVVNFLLQLYPKYNITSRITDKNLEEVMALADEYQVDFVLDKCEEFIQLSLSEELTVDKKLKYLWLCVTHRRRKYRDSIVVYIIDENLKDLRRSRYFWLLPKAEQNFIIRKRCEDLDDLQASVASFIPMIHAAFSEDERPCPCADEFGRRTQPEDQNRLCRHCISSVASAKFNMFP
ncbi:hypothetical protein BaRGS_00006532 [Batillaria attramentaria]|uniref:BTB domain-containing protein n=1 Tax=Batillaria attramentaria TaxID=370345 RepID=A0ABD0LSL1_9CAEN